MKNRRTKVKNVPKEIESKYEEGSKAFLRRIKQHVRGPVHRFAAIAPPDLSALTLDELRGMGIAEAELSDAGVEFSGKLSDCYRANLWLRTGSRLLCRLPSFRAGTVEELFYKVSSVRWELWLNPGIPLQVDGHVEYSRVQNESVVEKTILEAIQRRFRSQSMAVPSPFKREEGPDERAPRAPFTVLRQKLLVHLRENHCVISLDTSGEHLHFRGYRPQHGGAPLRETLAAAILLKAGWYGQIPLVDGMCGAGTIPIEGALLARRIPPGLHRPFLFEQWPSFEEKTWRYLCRKAEENALPGSPSRIVAIDREPGAIELARKNAERAGVGEDIAWYSMDLFSFVPGESGIPPGLLVLNPPYGKRIGGGGHSLYKKLGAHIRKAFQGWRFAIVAPDRSQATSLNLPSLRLWNIVHGGMPVWVAFGRL